MTPARWQEIDRLFGQAVELAGADRAAFLDRACAGDAELRAELVSLLDAAADDGRALRAAIEHEADALAEVAVASGVGRRVGSYRLGEPLGEGGMGVVYRAVRDDREYTREVAIKILRVGLGSPQAIARFRDERQILARLEHPGIVRLLDGGRTDDDLPYLVMELVPGVPITRYARDRDLSVRERVRAILPICDAVRYAHARLVIHRDLKPSNILVGADGAAKLLDFGIAKLLDPDADAAREARTVAGAAMLTLDYASPEQIRADPTSTATDVYSLGAVLYELLTDRPPHRSGASSVGSSFDVSRAICETDAARASTVAPVARRRELAGDLDNILTKALRRDPADRYRSIDQLADDLERHLHGHPVAARAPTVRYRAGKWLRRNRVVATIAAVAVTALVAIGAASLVRIQRARREIGDTVSQLYVEQARQLLFRQDPDRAVAFLAAALDAGLDTPAVRYLVATALRQLDQQEHVLHHAGSVRAVAWRPDGEVVATGAVAGEAHLWSAHTGAELASLAGHAGAVTTVAWSPDGTTLVTADAAGHVVVRDGATGRMRGELGTASLPVTDPAFVTDGRLAALRGDVVVVWDATTVTEVDRSRASFGIWGAAGGTVAVATGFGVHVTGPKRCDLDLFETIPTRIAVDHDGTRVAVAAGAAVAVVDVATCDRISQLVESEPIERLAFGPGPDGLLVRTINSGLRVWSVAGGILLANLSGHTGEVTSASVSPVGDRLVSTGADRLVVVWRGSGGLEQDLRLHAGPVFCSAFAPDGRAFVTGSADHTARIVSATKAGVVATLGASAAAVARFRALYRSSVAGMDPVMDAHVEHVAASRFTADGEVVTVAADGAITRWHGGTATRLPVSCERKARCEPSGDGARVVVTNQNLAFTVAWDGSRGPPIEHATPIRVLDVVANTRWVTTASTDGDLRLWDAATGVVTSELHVGEDVTAVAWTPDGARVATRGGDGVAVWEAAGALVRRFPSRTRTQRVVAIDASGARVLGPNDDGDLAVWEVATGRLLAVIEPHQSEISSAAFSPDGSYLATASGEMARLDDAATGEVLGYLDRTLTYDPDSRVAFDPSGDHLVVSGVETFARVWDVSPDRRGVDDILAALACRGSYALDGSVARPVAALDRLWVSARRCASLGKGALFR